MATGFLKMMLKGSWQGRQRCEALLTETQALMGVSVDMASVNVSGNCKVVTFTLDASDSIGYESASQTLKLTKRDRSVSCKFLSWNHAISGSDSSGAYDAVTTLAAERHSRNGHFINHKTNQLVLSKEDCGTWVIYFASLTDTLGTSQSYNHKALDVLRVASIRVWGCLR